MALNFKRLPAARGDVLACVQVMHCTPCHARILLQEVLLGLHTHHLLFNASLAANDQHGSMITIITVI